MTEHQQEPVGQPTTSGWATAGITFAAAIMVLMGLFEALAGVAAIADDGFFVAVENYAFDLDVTVWGWIHLIVGAFVLLAGLSLFARKAWAGVAAIVLAMLSALANFFTIPYYPAWSLLTIGLAVWVIWSLTRPGAVRV